MVNFLPLLQGRDLLVLGLGASGLAMALHWLVGVAVITSWRIAEAALRRDPRSRAIVLSGRLPAAHPLITRFPGRAFCLPKPLDPAALAACLQGPTFL